MEPNADVGRRTCRECGLVWTLSAKTAEWFKARGLSLPLRCRACRAQRRDQQVMRRA
jgi:hypothetical protein